MTPTSTQYMSALHHAQAVRLLCCDYLKTIRTGEITLAQAVEQCELPIRLDRLMQARARVGGYYARKLCKCAGLRYDPMTYRIAGDFKQGIRPLTVRERTALAAVCEEAGL